jgi:hypothetical protein
MSQRNYLLVSALVFTLVFALHVLRLFYGWSVMIGGQTVPVWTSWIGVVLSGLLAFEGFRLRK